MSLHADLLKQARQLATREPRKPKQASLRRAVSAAYYAVFHLLVSEAAARLLTGADRAGLRQCLGRAFVHADMKTAAQGFASAKVSERLQPALKRTSLPPELKRLAKGFVDLQQSRHEADYDTARRFTRQETLGLVETAEAIFRDWNNVRHTLPADTFLVALLTLRQMRT